MIYNQDMAGLKRPIIVFVYFAIFALAGLVLYLFLQPGPTCSDGKKNQGESGVDCGGPCQPCVEEPKVVPMEVTEAVFVYGGPNKYDIVATIHNPNVQYGTDRFEYRFVLKGPGGNVLAERSGQGYILPSETKYVIENNIEAQAVPYQVEVEITDSQWKEFSDYEKPALNTYNKRYNQASSDIVFGEVTALLRNESYYDLNSVDVGVVLKNADGRPIAANVTQIRSIRAREEREFKVFWPQRFPGEVQSVEIQSSSNVLDPQNFMKVSPGNGSSGFR